MAVNRELQGLIKRNREAWRQLNKAASKLESEANKVHSYTTKINNKSGYISNLQAQTVLKKMIELDAAHKKMQENLNYITAIFNQAVVA
jgi:hypothetical protein